MAQTGWEEMGRQIASFLEGQSVRTLPLRNPGVDKVLAGGTLRRTSRFFNMIVKFCEEVAWSGYLQRFVIKSGPS
jgi:hypothetical protein